MRGTLTAIKPDETITIRQAGYRDIETIAEMGARFFKEAEWSDVTSWDHESVTQTLQTLIDSDDGILLVCVKDGKVIGMAGGLVHPAYFNRHHKTGQELFWWVEPDHRSGVGGRLLEGLESAALYRGAQSWSMIALASLRPEVVGKVYQRRGYRASEQTFIKALS